MNLATGPIMVNDHQHLLDEIDTRLKCRSWPTITITSWKWCKFDGSADHGYRSSALVENDRGLAILPIMTDSDQHLLEPTLNLRKHWPLNGYRSSLLVRNKRSRLPILLCYDPLRAINCQKTPLNIDDVFDIAALEIHLKMMHQLDQELVPFVTRYLAPRSASCSSIDM